MHETSTFILAGDRPIAVRTKDAKIEDKGCQQTRRVDDWIPGPHTLAGGETKQRAEERERTSMLCKQGHKEARQR